MVFFRELEKIIPQFVWKHKKPRIAKAIQIKKKGIGHTDVKNRLLDPMGKARVG